MSRCGQHPIVMILVAAFVACSSPGLAAAGGYDGFWLRVGAVSEGPQHSLRKGVEIGGGWDWHTSSALALGVGASLARQGSQFGYSEFKARFLSFEGHVRGTIGDGPVRPLAELGLGYYLFDIHALWQPGSPALDDDWNAPGMWLGIGAEARLTENLAARLGVAYHLVAQGIQVEGGNLEDYFATGLTLEVALPRH